MRIGCLQFAPKVGDVDNNLNRADAVLSRADVEELDLLVLPELAFTGYNFKSLKEITPYFEPSGSGITSLWARTVALKYDCTVIAGYPEKVDVAPKWPTSPEYYNSAIVVSPDGETIANYRKSFLYYADERWALEGDGFYSGYLPGVGIASLGICMDLNPYKFEAPWDDYEFAFHALDVSANVVILSMAWMTRDEPREFSRMPNEPDLDTLTYWVTRLEPLIRADNRDEIIVVFANRCGVEGDATYAGTSAVLGIHHGEVTVYGLLGRGEKELLVVDTERKPYGKLLYRPEVLSQVAASHNSAKTPASGPDHQEYDVSDNESDAVARPVASESRQMESDYQSSPKDAGGDGTPVAPQRLRDSQGLATSNGDAAILVENSSDAEPTENAHPVAEADSETPLKQGRKPPTPISIPKPVPSDPQADVETVREEGALVLPGQAMRSPRTAVRPKLVIPQSPTMIPQQLYPDQPASAASAMSGRSVQSIRSNDSETSVQTIRSNHRPPEDSTPYPHSGMPLSGYPQRKKIYGGFVAIRPADQSFVPITPFDDLSPMSAMSWGWPNSANPFSSLNAAGAWPPSTPLAAVPEPVPWPALRGVSRPRSRSTRRLHSNGVTPIRRPTPPVIGWSKPGNQPEAHEAMTEWGEMSKNMEKLHNNDPEAESTRPSSPKSRNASRSRLHERPGSAMGRPDFAVAAQHLEKVANRVSSVSRTREKNEHSETESYFDDDSSSMSRNTSPAKVEDVVTTFELGDAVIPVVASPSLLSVQPSRHDMVPTPVALDYYRSASNPVQHYETTSISSRGARGVSRQVSRAQEYTYPRTPSRGRQPRPKPSTMTPQQAPEPLGPRRTRSTSIDSTRNDLLHRHVRRSSANNGGSLLSRNHSQNTILLPEGYTAEDFERVEDVACPNCPVHGDRSSSTNHSVSRSARRRVESQNRPRRRRSTSQNLRAPSNSSAPERIGLPLQPLHPLQPLLPLYLDAVAARQAEPRSIPEPRFTPAPVQRPAKRGFRKVKRSFTSSPVPRPSTAPPLPFNPPTPKAMSFIPDAGELESPGDDGLALTTIIKGKFVETQTEMGMQLPALA